MALFAYITDECRQDIRKQAATADVERFRQRLLDAQRTSLFDNFPPPYLKKRFKRQIRLIAAQYTIREHLVVVFLRMLVRGGSDYEQGFLNDPKGYGDRHFAPLVDMKRIEAWLDEQLKEAPPPKKPEPTTDERRYLWDVLGKPHPTDAEVLVCESEDWVRTVGDKRMRSKLVLLPNPLLDASENGASQECIIPVPNRGDLTIVGRYFPTHSKLFLAAAFSDPSKGEVEKVRERYASILSADCDSVTEEIILKHSIRAYPNELLLDENLWIDVEQDEASNLALSPEEASILESVHDLSTREQSVGFPLFINGRAGSGKSTILQYLFADYLRLYVSMSPSTALRHPLYFTCSSDLLQRTRSVVSGLLTCGHRYGVHRHDQHDDATDSAREQEALSGCFREFHGFLYSLLSREGKSGRFSRNGYVDYARFRILWNDKFGHDPAARKSLGADVSWHVIRSYIKGLSADGYLDREEYDEQPERERTVSTQTFSAIYEKVWNSWYRPLCESGECWDDQDLARKLLDDEAIRPEYPAIFCDEAQDFTRLELEVLFRLSLFSDRRLTPEELNRVPFAFAGDPFQTLNPTGFRWDAIKSAFVVKFLRSLDPTCKSGVKDLNYQELSYNYRSTRNVVRLCNSIQALRSVLFDIPSLRPQSTWQYEHASPPAVWFERGNGDVLNALRKETNLTIILPCQEGEEIAFVAGDEFLSSAVQRDEMGVPQNVLSATRAKGLEFTRVALYGFGTECFPDLLAPLTGGQGFSDIPEKALPREYFVNRLYVAASRPKRRLFIIDSGEGMKRLWRFVTDADTQEAVFTMLPHNTELWRENMGMLQPGTANSWSSDREDVKDVAERLEREGHAARDSYLLRSAAMNYQDVGDTFKMRHCRASALLYEQKYKKAGDAFAECEDYEQALAAYWEGSEYQAVLDLGATAPLVCTSIEHRVADFLSKGVSAKAGVDLLKLVEVKLSDKAFLERALPSQAWRSAISGMCEQLADPRRRGAAPGSAWMALAESAGRLASLGFSVSQSSIGMLFYRAGEWARAVSCWEYARETQTDEFRDASARILVADIETGRRAGPSAGEVPVLAEFYTRNKQCSLAVRYWAQADDEMGLSKSCALALEMNETDAALDAVKHVLDLFVRHGNWSDMIALVDECEWDQIRGEQKMALLELLKKKADVVLASATRLLAQSDLLPVADASQQKRVSDLLKRRFIEDATSWTRHTTPDVAGAAIERAGRWIDALQFYENVQAHTSSGPGQKRRAQERWVKNKHRQAEREEREQKTQPARRHAKEAEDAVIAWEIKNSNEIPDYPRVLGLADPAPVPATGPEPPAPSKIAPSLTPSEELRGMVASPMRIPAEVSAPEDPRRGQVVWAVGDLAFRYSRESGRINIEHQRTLIRVNLTTA